jgi:ribosomal protein L3 glutamine methyltransferase
MTLIQLIESQSQRLQAARVSFGHGTTNAFDEAAWLVLWALKRPLEELEKHAQTIVELDQIQLATDLVTQRIQTRRPAAYLTHEAWLQGVPFYVDERSIVPRSLIAELLADADETGSLDVWLTDQTHRVLDLCTGNGSLAVIAAMAFTEVVVDAADVSVQALEVARINVDKHNLAARIRLLQADVFDGVADQYDLILCNPPYVNAQSMSKLPPEYQAEPALALAGGTDGMDVVRRILAGALAHLNPHACLVLEIGHERRHFEQAFPKLEAAWLETSAGEQQVALITQEALSAYVARGQQPTA